jgi:hypothetical protein
VVKRFKFSAGKITPAVTTYSVSIRPSAPVVPTIISNKSVGPRIVRSIAVRAPAYMRAAAGIVVIAVATVIIIVTTVIVVVTTVAAIAQTIS